MWEFNYRGMKRRLKKFVIAPTVVKTAQKAVLLKHEEKSDNELNYRTILSNSLCRHLVLPLGTYSGRFAINIAGPVGRARNNCVDITRNRR